MPYRLLILADSISPTLQINYIRPLRSLLQDGSLAMAIYTEKSLSTPIVQRDLAESIRGAIKQFRPSAIIACRYAGPGAELLTEACRSRGVPLIYHLDDDLLAIDPLDRSHRSKHRDVARLKHLLELMQASTAIVVSTRYLAERLQSYGFSQSRMILQEIAAAAEPVTGRDTSVGRSEVVKFGYMGSRSHALDLSFAVPAIEAVLEQHQHLKFEIFGSLEIPRTLRKYACVHHPRVDDYDLFLRRLASLDWAFGLAPLRSTSFNLCKTNTKWVEYSAAGIPVLASDVPVYQSSVAPDRGMLVADDGWANAISQAANDPGWRVSSLTAARTELAKNYSLARMRSQLIGILRAL